MSLVFKVSNPGHNVGTADLRNLSLSSEANTFKPVQFSNNPHAVPAVGEESTTSTLHGLGFAPAFEAVAFGNVNTGYVNIPHSFTDLALDLRIWVDSTTVNTFIRNTGNLDDTIVTFKIILFANPLG